MRPGRFRASCDEILMAEIGPNASGGTENPLGKTEAGTHKVTSRPTAPNKSVMATPTCQRRRNLHGFRAFNIFPTHTIWRIIFFAARRNNLIHLIWPKASRSIIGRSPRSTRIIVRIFISLLLFPTQWQFVPCLLKPFFVLNIKQDVVMTITKCRTHIGRCTLLPHYVCNKVLAAKYLVANHF